MNILPLGIDEWPEASALLAANGLPSADLSPAVLLLGVRDASGLEGIAGLEMYGRVGLLRSLAVRQDRRRSGLGSALVLEAERLAALEGVEALYLLTTTAAEFFAHRGYAPEARDSAPDAIRRTSEFSRVCPSSAAFLWKPLGGASSRPGRPVH
jgi:amino-acid N-acetyltransferase